MLRFLFCYTRKSAYRHRNKILSMTIWRLYLFLPYGLFDHYPHSLIWFQVHIYSFEFSRIPDCAEEKKLKTIQLCLRFKYWNRQWICIHSIVNNLPDNHNVSKTIAFTNEKRNCFWECVCAARIMMRPKHYVECYKFTLSRYFGSI